MLIKPKPIRLCITCDCEPATVRFGCGHSCMCSKCLGTMISKQVSFVASSCPLCRFPINLGDIENEFSVANEPDFVQICPMDKDEPSIAMEEAVVTPIVRLSMLQNTILLFRQITYDGNSSVGAM